jgi:hypothetical protein
MERFQRHREGVHLGHRHRLWGGHLFGTVFEPVEVRIAALSLLGATLKVPRLGGDSGRGGSD